MKNNALALLFPASLLLDSASAQSPNIVLFLSDDQGWTGTRKLATQDADYDPAKDTGLISVSSP
ncbi:MAG: hypothetical protein ACR2QQ_01050 [Gammaproteobacteria bacterium]